MPPNRNNSTLRRREVRRNLQRKRVTGLEWFRQKAVIWAVAWAAALAVVVTLVTIVNERSARYEVGQIVSEAIVPRVEFRAINDEETRRQREDARDREPAVYKPNMAYLNQIHAGLDGLLQIGAEYTNIDQIPEDTRNNLHISNNDILELLREYNRDDEKKAEWTNMVNQFVAGVASTALLSEERRLIEIDKSERASGIMIANPILGSEISRNDTTIYGMGNLTPFRSRVTQFAEDYMPAKLRISVIDVVMQNPQPVYLFDKDTTDLRRTAAFENAREVEMTYRPTDVLISAGEQISALDFKLLNEEKKAYNTHLKSVKLWMVLPSNMAYLIGRAGALFGLALALWGYILAYNVKVAKNPMRGLALTALLVGCLLIASAGPSAWKQYLYATLAFPTLLTTIVLAIAYDRRFALAVGGFFSILTMVCLNHPFGTLIVLLVGVGATVAQLNEIRNRSKLVIVGFWSGLAMAITALFVGMAKPSLMVVGHESYIWFGSAVVWTTAVVTGIFVQGILPAIERVFRVTTSMTLRELNDASHPLLRRMAQEAPGTYQHSLRIADMAEAAAAEIGADDLLCKVGAMYHDIGKMNKPLYFVENQGGGPNKHAKLSPAMSLLIIVGHVKDGIEMAREYGLPPKIRQFIETHHGTTLVEYFYHAAMKQTDTDKGPAPTEFEFRYPGPKPQTREAAILMICDCVEGAARVLPEPTPVRLEQLVHNMTTKRLMDGQFDECSITLQELNKVEQAITRTVCAIYHGRIAYPSAEEPQDPSAKPQSAQPATAAS